MMQVHLRLVLFHLASSVAQNLGAKGGRTDAEELHK